MEGNMKEECLKHLFDLLDRHEDNFLELSFQLRLSCQMKRRESHLSGFMTGSLVLEKYLSIALYYGRVTR